MPPLPNAPASMKVKIAGNTSSKPLAHIMHLEYTGGSPVATDCIAIATAFRSAWVTNIIPLIGPSVTYNLWEVTDLATSTGAVGSVTTPAVGTHTQSVVPPTSLCLTLSWKIARHYRGGHPRTYLPYANGSDLLNGTQVATAYQTLATTNAGAFLIAVNAITSGAISVVLAAVSYYTGHALRPAGVPSPIQTVVIHPRVDSQRRRLGKEIP